MPTPRLEPIHRRIVWVWILAAVVLLVVSLIQPFPEGPEGTLLRILIAVPLIQILGGLVALAAGVARFLFTGRHWRTAVLIAIPAVVPIWLFITSLDTGSHTLPRRNEATGMVTDLIPEGYLYRGTGGGPYHSYLVYVDETNDEAELKIGTRREARTYPSARTVVRGDREFMVVVEPDRTLVVENLGMVKMEVSSNVLSEQTLLDVAESTRYDPDLDLNRRLADP